MDSTKCGGSRVLLRWALAPLAGALLGLVCMAPASEAVGPWRGRMVDAETGQPLQGVVIVARWDKESAFAGPTLHDVVEVVTDANGRYEIPRRILFTRLPFLTEFLMEVVIFKPGYGRPQLRAIGGVPIERVPKEMPEDLDLSDILEKDAEFHLPPLKTREERLKFLDRDLLTPAKVPAAKIPRFWEAYEQERKYLGFRD